MNKKLSKLTTARDVALELLRDAAQRYYQETLDGRAPNGALHAAVMRYGEANHEWLAYQEEEGDE